VFLGNWKRLDHFSFARKNSPTLNEISEHSRLQLNYVSQKLISCNEITLLFSLYNKLTPIRYVSGGGPLPYTPGSLCHVRENYLVDEKYTTIEISHENSSEFI
jgi:hypothetical protein